MTLIEQAIKRRNDEAWLKRPVFSLRDVSIEGIKEFRRDLPVIRMNDMFKNCVSLERIPRL